jgi:RNA polymerase-binding transcription factor DksA
MNFGSNAAFDLAAERAEQERDAKIAEAQNALRQMGTCQCDDCGVDISSARRNAYPAATRCQPCQTRHEKRRR